VATSGTVVQISVSRGGVPKRAVERAWMDVLGLEGDRHNDRVGHGGPERAVCLMAMEVLEKLQREGHQVLPGMLGENVTVRGLDWSQIKPGDRLQIGTALVEVTRYTTPCKNVAYAFNDRDFTRVLHTKNPGDARVYAKVIQPSELVTGMAVAHLPKKAG
jgi:MOSC domain-containing protein YiiM